MSLTQIKIPKDGSRQRVPRYQFVFFAITAAAIPYAIYTRTVDDFFIYPVLFGLPAALGLYAAIISRTIRGEGPNKTWKGILLATLGPLVFAYLVVGVTYYGVLAMGKDLYECIDPILDSRVSRAIFMGSSALLVGTALFWLRVNLRFVYGFHEAVVGVLIAVYTSYLTDGVPSSWEPKVYIGLLTAGAYLVVRGLDNMYTGITKEPYDAFGRDIFGDALDEKEDPNVTAITVYPSSMFLGRVMASVVEQVEGATKAGKPPAPPRR